MQWCPVREGKYEHFVIGLRMWGIWGTQCADGGLLPEIVVFVVALCAMLFASFVTHTCFVSEKGGQGVQTKNSFCGPL